MPLLDVGSVELDRPFLQPFRSRTWPSRSSATITPATTRPSRVTNVQLANCGAISLLGRTIDSASFSRFGTPCDQRELGSNLAAAAVDHVTVKAAAGIGMLKQPPPRFGISARRGEMDPVFRRCRSRRGERRQLLREPSGPASRQRRAPVDRPVVRDGSAAAWAPVVSIKAVTSARTSGIRSDRRTALQCCDLKLGI